MIRRFVVSHHRCGMQPPVPPTDQGEGNRDLSFEPKQFQGPKARCLRDRSHLSERPDLTNSEPMTRSGVPLVLRWGPMKAAGCRRGSGHEGPVDEIANEQPRFVPVSRNRAALE